MNASLEAIASGLTRKNITMFRYSGRSEEMAWFLAECSYERGELFPVKYDRYMR
jgi:hypothetical protein